MWFAWAAYWPETLVWQGEGIVDMPMPTAVEEDRLDAAPSLFSLAQNYPNPFVGRLSGVLAGVLLMGAIDTAINVMGLPPHNTQVIRAGMVLLAVLPDSATSASRRRLLD